MKNVIGIFGLAIAISLAACGGGGSNTGNAANAKDTSVADSSWSADSSSIQQGAPDAMTNSVPIVVDLGPPIFALTGRKVVNMPYVDVTLCTPGNSTECATIDHVLVDTGSVGLRILKSALIDGKVKGSAVQDPVTGSPLRECVQYADGYSWGSVVTTDVQLGKRKLPSLPVNVIGDPADGAAPGSCISGPDISSLNAFGSNGVLGVGNFLHDCGDACVSHAVAGWYYVCPSTGCRPTQVPLDRQLPNPVAALGSDNNGVTLALPALPQGGASSANGMLYFGIGTQANNAPHAAKLLTVGTDGTLETSYGGVSQRAFIDSGSNGYFFNDASIGTCSVNKLFYCPRIAGAPASLTRTAAILGRNGVSQTVDFTVDNLDLSFTGQAALPGLAAPASGLVGGTATLFGWGLPFFFGRTVHVLFEGSKVEGTTGPAIGF